MVIAISRDLRSKKSLRPYGILRPERWTCKPYNRSFPLTLLNAYAVLCRIGACCFTDRLGRKRVKSVRNKEPYREHIESTFNAFCKIVHYHAAFQA